MSYGIVTHQIAFSTDDHSVATAGVNDTGANLLLTLIADYIVSTQGTPTDSKSNSWTNLTQSSSAVNSRAMMSYSGGTPTVGASHTYSYAAATSYPSIAEISLSGAKVASPADQQNGSTATAVTSLATGSITPSENNCVVVAMLAFSGAQVVSIDSGFNILDQVALGTFNFGLAVAYKIQTVAAAVNPTWSWSGSDAGVAARITSFKAAPFVNLFRMSNLSGLQGGGPFFIDPLG